MSKNLKSRVLEFISTILSYREFVVLSSKVYFESFRKLFNLHFWSFLLEIED